MELGTTKANGNPHDTEDTETGLQNLLWNFFYGFEVEQTVS